jgi:hypothetical protein
VDRVQRLRWLLANVAQLAQSPVRAPKAATESAGLQQALIEWNAVDGSVAVTLLTDLPDSLDVEPTIAQRAAEQLTRMSEKPSRALLELLASLDKRGKAPASGPLVKVLESDRRVRAFTRRALEDKTLIDTRYFNDAIMRLREADPAVVEARLDDVLEACLASRHPWLAPAVLAALKPSLARALVQRWAATLGTRDLVRDGLWCVGCLADERVPQKVAEQLAGAVRKHARKLPQRDFDRWYAAVTRQLRPDMRPVWDSLFVQETPRPARNLWIKRDGSR